MWCYGTVSRARQCCRAAMFYVAKCHTTLLDCWVYTSLLVVFHGSTTPRACLPCRPWHAFFSWSHQQRICPHDVPATTLSTHTQNVGQSASPSCTWWFSTACAHSVPKLSYMPSHVSTTPWHVSTTPWHVSRTPHSLTRSMRGRFSRQRVVGAQPVLLPARPAAHSPQAKRLHHAVLAPHRVGFPAARALTACAQELVGSAAA